MTIPLDLTDNREPAGNARAGKLTPSGQVLPPPLSVPPPPPPAVSLPPVRPPVNGAGEAAASELGGFAAVAPPIAPPVDRAGLAPVAATKVAVGTVASVSVPPAAIGEPGKGFVAAVRRMFGLPELMAPGELPSEPRRSLFDYSPAWLVSLIFHLIVLMALALFVTPVGEGLNNLLLTIGQSDVESVGEFAEFSIGEEMEVDDPTDAMTLDSFAEVDALEMA
ncbi:MAG: hypothetical protein EHM77_00985, partial [Planctomycetaceae bacterium]